MFVWFFEMFKLGIMLFCKYLRLLRMLYIINVIKDYL